MNSLQRATLLVLSLALFACGGNGKGHNNQNGQHGNPPATKAEFGDVVQRMMQQKDNNSGDPEEISPETWSYSVNENEAAFNHLF